MRLLPLVLLFAPLVAAAAPLTIDLTTPIPPASTPPYGPGTAKSISGHTITADSRSLLLDGKPWTPVAGEFHYDRYPQSEWRNELLKMKAGGIDVISTYVFWIIQEEQQGKFDWSGQRSLRDFLILCQRLGLKVFIRLGPWCHGEMRNGGFPDWVQNSGAKLRSADPKFLALVDPLYKEEAKQMVGLYWKDGGPIIGAQVDNENGNAPYLRALKSMAVADGIDVPYYAMTGWDIKPLDHDLLLLFGAYFDGFWGGTLEKYRRDFMFTSVRASNNLGAQMNDRNPSNSDNITKFPYLCVEIGPGMMSSYAKRIKVDVDAVTNMAMIKMGEGNNMPGYYMYHGGTNPDGQMPSLQETHPNFMPEKDYDFQTAIGADGQVREQFHTLYEQHLFYHDFGAKLSQMPAFFPDAKPTGVDDFNTLRWDVRSDGSSGFVFISNEQPYVPLPAHDGVQFQLKTAAGNIVIPHDPITIPSGSYGFWPFNMDCDGVTLDYATAQPLCRLQDAKGDATYFFAALDGITPELSIRANASQEIGPVMGLDQANGVYRAANPAEEASVPVTLPGGHIVRFVILTKDEARHLARANFAGEDRLFISKAAIVPDGQTLQFMAETTADMAFSVYPALPLNTDKSIENYSPAKNPDPHSLFASYTIHAAPDPAPLEIGVTQIKPADSAIVPLSGSNEATWSQAADYSLSIPKEAAGRRVILNIHYIGDVARLYVGDKLFDDHFWNGDAFPIALWRIPADQWSKIHLKVIPASDQLLSRLPQQGKDEYAAAKASSSLDKVTVSAADQLEVKITP